MDSTLAGRLVEVLAKAMPHLLGVGSGSTAEESLQRAGDDDWEAGTALWGLVRPRLEPRPAANEAVRDLVQAPEDPDIRAALRNQLRKILSADLALGDLLAEILEAQAPAVAYSATSQAGGVAQGERPVAAGANGVAVSGDVRGDVHPPSLAQRFGIHDTPARPSVAGRSRAGTIALRLKPTKRRPSEFVPSLAVDAANCAGGDAEPAFRRAPVGV